jgi:hypothetical protein
MRPATILLALLALSCAKAAGPGQRCIADADCEDALACYELEATSSRRCLAACDPASVVLCTSEDEGSLGLCAPIDGAATPGVCLVGGTADPGDACSASLDCAASGICVITGGEGRCERVCDTEAPDCPAGEACNALTVGERRGICVDAPDGGA